MLAAKLFSPMSSTRSEFCKLFGLCSCGLWAPLTPGKGKQEAIYASHKSGAGRGGAYISVELDVYLWSKAGHISVVGGIHMPSIYISCGTGRVRGHISSETQYPASVCTCLLPPCVTSNQQIVNLVLHHITK